MKHHSVDKKAVLLLSVAVIYQFSTPQAEARRFFAAGPNGTAGAFASSNQYGQRAGARVFGKNAGAGISGGQYTGPNGGTFGRAGAFGYQRGVGAARVGGWNATAPDGATASKRVGNVYNAQTGTGTRLVSKDATGANGTQYGITKDTNYTKGQGFTSQVDTDRHGDYQVNYAPGSGATITPDQ
jgi:hypothetical protein